MEVKDEGRSFWSRKIQSTLQRLFLAIDTIIELACIRLSLVLHFKSFSGSIIREKREQFLCSYSSEKHLYLKVAHSWAEVS